MGHNLTWNEFIKVDMRVGTIIEAQDFPEARNPAYKLKIDFGNQIGILKSSAQITDLYKPDSLIGRKIIAVVNFPVKQIGPFKSECLVLGTYSHDGVSLLSVDEHSQNGDKVG